MKKSKGSSETDLKIVHELMMEHFPHHSHNLPFPIQVKHSRSSSETHENSSENMHVTEIQMKHRKVK